MNVIQIILLAIITSSIGLFFLIKRFFKSKSPQPTNIGLVDGKFSPCKYEGCCINSQVSKKYNLPPVDYDGDMKKVHEKLVDTINAHGRSKIIVDEPNYIYTKFTTGIWKFTDDTEFFIDEKEKKIHFRSSARIGNNDLGQNKARMQKLFAHYNGEITLHPPNVPVPKENIPKKDITQLTLVSLIATLLIGFSPLIHNVENIITIIVVVILTVFSGLLSLSLPRLKEIKPQYTGTTIWILILVFVGIFLELYVILIAASIQYIEDIIFYRNLEKIEI